MINIEKMKVLRGDQRQRVIADAVGISQNHYSRIENGQRIPSLKIAVKIANYFDISLDEMVTLPSPRPRRRTRGAEHKTT